MSLNAQQKKFIADVDSRVKTILANDGDEQTLLVQLLEFMPGLKTIIDSPTEKEMDLYAHAYPGFYRYMKVLERLAQGIANGNI